MTRFGVRVPGRGAVVESWNDRPLETLEEAEACAEDIRKNLGEEAAVVEFMAGVPSSSRPTDAEIDHLASVYDVPRRMLES